MVRMMKVSTWEGARMLVSDVDLTHKEHNFLENFWIRLCAERRVVEPEFRSKLFSAIFNMEVSKIREMLADQPISKGTKNRLTRMEKIAIMKRLRDG